jgi:hypothetical protein
MVRLGHRGTQLFAAPRSTAALDNRISPLSRAGRLYVLTSFTGNRPLSGFTCESSAAVL